MSNKDKKEGRRFSFVSEDDLNNDNVFESNGNESGSSRVTREDYKKQKEKEENNIFEENFTEQDERESDETMSSKVDEEPIQKHDEDEEFLEDVFEESVKRDDLESNVSVKTREEKVNSFSMNSSKSKEEQSFSKSRLRIHFSFGARVIFLVLSIILLFVVSCVLILGAVNLDKEEKIKYDEVGNVGYKVCLIDNDYYHDNCLSEGMEYVSSLTDKIAVNFDYNVDFSTKVDYDLSYHVVGVTKIYSADDNNKVLYQNEDLLVEKTDIPKLDESIQFEKDIVVDYPTFNANVVNYMSRYSANSIATLEVILYLDEPTETRQISSVTIPLGTQTYVVSKTELSNKNKSVVIKDESWDTYNSVCASIGIVLLLVDLLVLFRTTKFVFNATAKRDKFRAKLGQILRDYDRMIVIARDGFIPSGDKELIKVADFSELLDARDMLQKPIIYSKINNVKSEFIVEDSDVLYKYVMKESDFSN